MLETVHTASFSTKSEMEPPDTLYNSRSVLEEQGSPLGWSSTGFPEREKERVEPGHSPINKETASSAAHSTSLQLVQRITARAFYIKLIYLPPAIIHATLLA